MKLPKCVLLLVFLLHSTLLAKIDKEGKRLFLKICQTFTVTKMERDLDFVHLINDFLYMNREEHDDLKYAVTVMILICYSNLSLSEAQQFDIMLGLNNFESLEFEFDKLFTADKLDNLLFSDVNITNTMFREINLSYDHQFDIEVPVIQNPDESQEDYKELGLLSYDYDMLPFTSKLSIFITILVMLVVVFCLYFKDSYGDSGTRFKKLV